MGGQGLHSCSDTRTSHRQSPLAGFMVWEPAQRGLPPERHEFKRAGHTANKRESQGPELWDPDVQPRAQRHALRRPAPVPGGTEEVLPAAVAWPLEQGPPPLVLAQGPWGT